MVNLSNITVDFGERIIFKSGDFLPRPGGEVGPGGPHGAGRSTLLKITTGQAELSGAPRKGMPCQSE